VSISKEAGVLFPEGKGVKMDLAYQIPWKDKILIGWYFEGDLVQGFDYSKYPIDHKRIKLRMWPKNMEANVILTPDLGSYSQTKPLDIFGLDKNIVLAGYTVLDTFFYYKLFSYDTNLGMKMFPVHVSFQELHFSVALKRNILEAFLKLILPLLVIVIIEFSALMLESRNEKISVVSGFSLERTLSLCAMVLFIIILAHTQIRNYISSNEIVYIEYIYFIFYGSLIYVVFNAFLYTNVDSTNPIMRCLTYEDNLFPKALFLPLLFGSILFVSTYVLK
jgi:hypothetical protein